MSMQNFQHHLDPTGDYLSKKEHTGTETLENIVIPLRASTNATSCGVETINAPAIQQRKVTNN